jgi:hypothetical protein
MRKILLAGAAVAAAAAYMPTTAHAQAASSPVTVYIGGRLFQGIFFSNSTGQNNAGNKYGSYQEPNYFRLYPSADYAAPNGIHYGFSAEMRSGPTTSGGGVQNDTTNWHRAFGYVSSAQFGKFLFGVPAPALETAGEYGVGTDFDTGGWDGEYGLPGAFGSAKWMFVDNYDTYTAFEYVTPSFANFGAVVSFAPYDTGLGGNNTITSSSVFNPQVGHFKNQFEGAVTYGGTFGAVGLKAQLGGAWSSYVKDDTNTERFKDVALLDAGVAGTIAGFTVGGHLDVGKFGVNWEPLQQGSKTTWAYAIEANYALPNPAVPLTFGAAYYGYKIDASQYDSSFTPGSKVTADTAAVGGVYKLVPGVTLFLDFLWAQQKAPSGYSFDTASSTIVPSGSTGTSHHKIDSWGFGPGVYFQW